MIETFWCVRLDEGDMRTRTRTLFCPIAYVQYAYIIPEGNVRSRFGPILIHRNHIVSDRVLDQCTVTSPSPFLASHMST